VRHGHGLRIRGAHGARLLCRLETATPAVPGRDAAVKALCVAPFGNGGRNAGGRAAAGVRARRRRATPASRSFASSLRRDDRVGMMLEDVAGNDNSGSRPHRNHPAGKKGSEGKLVRSILQAVVTEIGTLELRCLEKGGPGKWKLELNVRMKE